ncbi:MAG: HD domain-containing protein [Paludibacteraceae bacterium]|nr:HD domain-containing protein [Paludibacteraceae bacterium]
MQQNKRKIINDPVLGFINIPSEFLYDLIQHPYMQRLNRIKQLGLASFVYPGTQHTRFLHSIGAMHLMTDAIAQLKAKGNDITDDEASGLLAAILLHDIGHTPFSHTLENVLIKNFNHEQITLLLIERINKEFGGTLHTAISIFKNEYPKRYLHQLVSGQVDMDRLDYLIRDSFFSGVAEGTIGAERIIKMLTVKDDSIAIEAKGIYSIENFLIARRLMYWQVYLHKTAVAAEKMLVNILTRAKELSAQGTTLFASPALSFFITKNISDQNFPENEEAIQNFIQLDDSDITSAIKVWMAHTDKVLSTLSNHFINRKLFKVKISDTAFNPSEIEDLNKKYQQYFSISKAEATYFYAEGPIQSDTYNPNADNIKILYNDGQVKEISDASDMLNTNMLSSRTTKYYLCYLQL